MATSHEIGTTSLQNDSRQVSRKRKQNMPAPAAHASDTASSSSGAVSQNTTDNLSELKSDIKLSALIKATALINNFSEELVLSCALNLKINGKTLNSATLLEECELRVPGSTFQSYTSDVDNSYSVLSEPVEISSPLTLESPESNLPSHSSDYLRQSSLQSVNISSSPSSQSYSRRSSIPIRDSELNRQRVTTSYKHSTSDSTQSHSDSGEDSVDGYCPLTVAGVSASELEWAQCTSGPLNDLNKSSLAAMPASLPVAMGNMVSNLARQDPEPLSRQQSPSHQKSSTVFRGVTSRDGARLTDISSNKEFETKKTNAESETIPVGRASIKKKAEFAKLCFELVEKEHGLLEKSRLCSLCSSRPRDVTFLPCGHFTSCRSCAEPTYICPCCNRSILATVDTYLS